MSTKNTQTLKGFRDFLPEDQAVQNYIFNTWREVCLNFGFEEYQGPTLEYIEIYNKSGDDVGTGGKQLFSFVDQAGRKIALRPELTPSVGRIVAANQNELVKPVKWFSIGNFFRAEKPQKGRTREFWQLNADIFGVNDILSDFEVISLALNIMLAFGATEKMFKLFINNRKFSNYYFTQILKVDSPTSKNKLLKIIDAYPKYDDAWLEEELQNINVELRGVKKYLSLTTEALTEFGESEGANELLQLFAFLKNAGLDKYVEFNPGMARGFDYYTGMVFEVFDTSPDNNRSLFGGGRYDDLLDIFDAPKMPAVGFAPGDVTTRLFLENWGLLPSEVKITADCLVTVFSKDLTSKSLETASALRSTGLRVDMFSQTEVSLGNQIKYADRKSIPYVVVVGPEEVEKNMLTLKDMASGSQEQMSLEDAVIKIAK